MIDDPKRTLQQQIDEVIEIAIDDAKHPEPTREELEQAEIDACPECQEEIRSENG